LATQAGATYAGKRQFHSRDVSQVPRRARGNVHDSYLPTHVLDNKQVIWIEAGKHVCEDRPNRLLDTADRIGGPRHPTVRIRTRVDDLFVRKPHRAKLGFAATGRLALHMQGSPSKSPSDAPARHG